MFVDKQKRLLVQTYNAAWQKGVDSYGKGTPPEKPDPVRRAVALAPAFKSLNAMADEFADVGKKPVREADPSAQQKPTVSQRLKQLFRIGVGTAAAVKVAGSPREPSDSPSSDTGASEPASAASDDADAAGSVASAVRDWVINNAYRLDGADSVVWAGEQAGYGEAADADGQLLGWDDTGDASECGDCHELANMPPQPLSEWPCTPGDGATECNIGCRCELTATGDSVLPNDTYAPALTGSQSALIDKLVAAQADAMSAMMPDSQYLE
jgi:hypothetical protein